MGCFTSACFGNYKNNKNTTKKCHCNQSNEIQEAMKLLAPQTKSIEYEKTVGTNSETEIKSNEQMSNIIKKELILDYSNIKTHMDGNLKNESEEEAKDEVAGSFQENHKDLLISKKKNLGVTSNGITFDADSKLDCCFVDEESSESLFSLSIDSKRRVSIVEIGEREVCSPLKEINSFSSNRIGKRNQNIMDEEEDKENVNLHENLILPLMSEGVNLKFKQQSAVLECTSLSSWLVESDKSIHKRSINGNSPESEKNYQERKQLKEETLVTDQSLSRCGGGDDQPGIGTVGSYWRQICLQTGRDDE